MISKLKVTSVLTLLLLIGCAVTKAQSKKNPDELDGFREFKFYNSMDDFMVYDLQFYEDEFLKPFYKLKLPDGENSFLGTEIIELRLFEFKNQLIKVILILKNDVGEIVKEMFEDSPEYIKEKYEEEESWRRLGLRPISLSTTSLMALEKCYEKFRSPHMAESIKTKQQFHGINTDLWYGENNKVMRSYVLDNSKICDNGSYYRSDKLSENRYFLSLSANRYEEKINKKQVKEHFDTYLSDFGIDNHPISREKSKYIIPLFPFGNSYSVKVLFGNKILNELVLDTGSDRFVIGNNLYQSLLKENLIKDLNETDFFVNASGSISELKRVIVKEIQINDLKINAIEAFVNDSADISLLGQSFLKRFGLITLDYSKNIMIIEK